MASFRKRKSERGRQLSQRAGDAVIGVCGHDESGAAGAGSRDAQSEVVGLAAGAGEHDVTDLGRKGAEQFFREVEHGLMQVARMRVEHGGLPRNRLHDLRVAVPDGCDVVVGVQIAVAGGVVEPDAFAADELDRLVVEQPVRRPEQPASPRDHVLCRNGLVGGGHLSTPHRRRVESERRPGLATAWPRAVAGPRLRHCCAECSSG